MPSDQRESTSTRVFHEDEARDAGSVEPIGNDREVVAQVLESMTGEFDHEEPVLGACFSAVDR